MSGSNHHIIIVAGGSGKRMNSAVPKQFLEVGSKNILHHTMDAFLKAMPGIHIVLVLPEDQMDAWDAYSNTQNFKPNCSIAAGGAERFWSVKNGLGTLRGKKGIVGVHDGVRPLVSAETIQRCYSAAEVHGAAIPVMPVVESLRKLDGKSSVAVPRKDYVRVQTPQCFELDVLQSAYEQGFNPLFTDDASVVESKGHPIHLVEGNSANIKITTPEDLLLFEGILRSE